jgi:ribosomal-protein-alanine N-acetyltransferase
LGWEDNGPHAVDEKPSSGAIGGLGNRRIRLREFGLEDVPAVVRYSADAEVARYTVWEPGTEESAGRFVEAAIQSGTRHPRSVYELAIVEPRDGDLIGAARLGIESIEHRRADIGYVLGRPWWGQGLATEVVEVLVDLGFRRLSLHRLWATTHPDNIASARVLEKVGFTYEGRLRDHLHVKGG